MPRRPSGMVKKTPYSQEHAGTSLYEINTRNVINMTWLNYMFPRTTFEVAYNSNFMSKMSAT